MIKKYCTPLNLVEFILNYTDLKCYKKEKNKNELKWTFKLCDNFVFMISFSFKTRHTRIFKKFWDVMIIVYSLPL